MTTYIIITDDIHKYIRRTRIRRADKSVRNELNVLRVLAGHKIIFLLARLMLFTLTVYCYLNTKRVTRRTRETRQVPDTRLFRHHL